MENKRFIWPVTPLANKENIVKGKVYRFTVLTNRLIRMEYDESGVFEDRASQSAFHRDFPKVEFESEITSGILKIETDSLVLTYKENCAFNSDTLKITLKTPPATTWHFGDEFETLGGTVSTLDRINGEVPVENGVCSRNGFSVIDDSGRMILDEHYWPDVRNENTLDLYFFGYGHDYQSAVADLCRLTGRPPLLPAYALGNWWSRYHEYTQEEYLTLMEKFKNEDLPFSVSVVDMDWHITDVEGAEHDKCSVTTPGWTGYTWNQELFPDYKQFLKELHTYNVKTALNLHPASGIRKHEAMYEDMCKALGKEADGSPCSLDILNPDYMEKYFDVVHHPYEEDGVDFWWMDWQQGRDYWWIHEPNENGKLKDRREVLDPLWMLNHLHIIDIQRDGKRPMFFSRYCGPGSQRYPVGFSGDTFVTWDSLNFQPCFTNCASNIGYSWWSHDIGGHMYGYRDDDLINRWIQLGVFSPINRLHSSCNPFINKEPWDYNAATEKSMRESLKLRHMLFPYIYTMNYRTHTELKPIVSPMYYQYPENEGAYEAKNQYFFGSQLMVAPITEPLNKATGLGHVKVWLPKGIWTDFFTGATYDGMKGRTYDMYRDSYSIPVLLKAGAIVPMNAHVTGKNTLTGAQNMEIVIAPGADNSFTLYEDAGDGADYVNGAYATTEMTLSYSDTRTVFTVNGAKGDLSLIPRKREYEIKLRGFNAPEKVLVNSKEAKFTFDSATHTVSVIVKATAKKGFVLEVEGEDLQNRNADRIDKAIDILKRAQVGNPFKERIYNYILKNYDPEATLLERFIYRMVEGCEGKDHLDVIDALIEQLLYDKVRY